MKAKEFWKFLCNDMDYRFFAGVPCCGLKPLYDTMSSEFLHYIPAVKEDVALALTSGARIAGTKSAMLMDFDRIYSLLDCITSFNHIYKVPVLIVAYCSSESAELTKTLTVHKIPHRILRNLKRDLGYVIKQIEDLETPGVIIIKEEALL